MSLILASATAAIVPPARVGAWSRGAAQVVAPADIFAYMDGAGELYLAYRLVRLETYEYTAEPARAGESDRAATEREDPILLELYRLESSDDGYGLLSGDWGGEPIVLDSNEAAPVTRAVAAGTSAPPRALYGAGLLRAWSDDLYVRVLAGSETQASRAAVIELARAVVAGRANPQPPQLVAALPDLLAENFRLRPDSVVFLRSHLVLNSVYFLGTADMLGLSAAEAVMARYAPPDDAAAAKAAPKLRLLVIRYPTEAAARDARARFHEGYLKGSGADKGTSAVADATVAHVEDGWMGDRQEGRHLVLVFEAPDAATVGAVLDAVQP